MAKELLIMETSPASMALMTSEPLAHRVIQAQPAAPAGLEQLALAILVGRADLARAAQLGRPAPMARPALGLMARPEPTVRAEPMAYRAATLSVVTAATGSPSALRVAFTSRIMDRPLAVMAAMLLVATAETRARAAPEVLVARAEPDLVALVGPEAPVKPVVFLQTVGTGGLVAPVVPALVVLAELAVRAGRAASLLAGLDLAEMPRMESRLKAPAALIGCGRKIMDPQLAETEAMVLAGMSVTVVRARLAAEVAQAVPASAALAVPVGQAEPAEHLEMVAREEPEELAHLVSVAMAELGEWAVTAALRSPVMDLAALGAMG